MSMLRRSLDLDRVNREVRDLESPDAVFKTSPWQPRGLVEQGLRQWLRCTGAALRDDQVIGMPSQAVDEAWHGFILCTARYAAFCDAAYGRFLHHHPEGGTPSHLVESIGNADAQLGRTVVAWAMVAAPGEPCVLWDLDERVGRTPVGDPRRAGARRPGQARSGRRYQLTGGPIHEPMAPPVWVTGCRFRQPGNSMHVAHGCSVAAPGARFAVPSTGLTAQPVRSKAAGRMICGMTIF